MRILLLSCIFLPAVTIGDPNQNLNSIFHHDYGFQNSLRYTEALKMHLEVNKKVREALDDGDTLMTSWPFLKIFESNYSGYGKAKKLNLVVDLAPGNKLPDAIVWVSYPEQIPRDQIDQILTKGEYSAEYFQYDKQKVIFYKLKDGYHDF